jgi:hypothetical protein
MTEVRIELGLTDDRPIAGFAAKIEEAPNLDEFDLALQLRAVAQQLGTGIPGDQSVAGDLFRKLIRRVRGRKLVEDRGVHEVEVPWLCLHAPAGGTARLQLEDKESGTSGFKFSVVGSGLGDGWTFGAQEQRDFQEREPCTSVVEAFQLHVRSYAYQDQPDDVVYRSDIVARVGTIVRELERCSLCEPSPEDEPVLAQKAGPAIDLVADSVGQKLAQQLVLSGTSELELGLSAKLPGDLGLSAGVTCKREVSSTCSVKYAFPGGKRYQPMRLMQFADLPFWHIG